MTFRDALYERARRARRRIVLPEGRDDRVRAAATRIEQLGLGAVQLLDGTAPPSPLPEMIRLLRSRHADTQVASRRAAVVARGDHDRPRCAPVDGCRAGEALEPREEARRHRKLAKRGAITAKRNL